VESVDFERLDLGVDQRHLLTPFGIQNLTPPKIAQAARYG